VVTTVAGALTSLTAGFAFGKDVQSFAIPIATVLVAVAAFLWRRVLRLQRQAAAEEEWRKRERETPGGTAAFRGPLPYREGDALPGARRRDDVRTTAASVGADGFTFGVVTGELGCGKTSLLDAGLRPALEAQGFVVEFVASPRQLWPRQTAADAGPAARVRAFAKALRERVTPAEDDKKRVLIVDQMEELFADVKEPQDRHEVGKLFEKLTRAGVRVVLGLRRDYFLDVYNLSEHIPPLIAGQNLIQLDYFLPKEAEEIVKECVTRDARVSLDPEFPRTVVVDLTKDDERVRPIELQIVCAALRGSLRLTDYRGAGGAAGILSKYIERTIDSCPHPQAGRRLLRAACRFADKLKEDPQTVPQFVAKIGLPNAPVEVVGRVIRHFEGARLLVRAATDGTEAGVEPRYLIPHDYLLGPIANATRQEVTQTEEADQYLQFYLREKATPPLGRWWFIRQNADRERLREPVVRRFLRRSLLVHAGRFVGLLVGFVAVNLLLLGLSTSERVWEREVFGRTATEGARASSGSGGGYARVWSKSKTGPAVVTVHNGAAKLWHIGPGGDPGNRLGTVTPETLSEGSDCQFSPDARYLLYRTPGAKKTSALELVNRTSFPTFIPNGSLLALRVTFDETGENVAYMDGDFDAVQPRTYTVGRLKGEVLGSVIGVQPVTSLGSRAVLTTTPPRLVLSCLDDTGRPTIRLFNYTTGKPVADLIDSRIARPLDFVVDPLTKTLLTFEDAGPDPNIRKVVIRRRALLDGSAQPQSREFYSASEKVSAYITTDGHYLLAFGGLDDATVFDRENLTPVVPAHVRMVRAIAEEGPVVAWESADGCEIWNLQDNIAARRHLPGFSLATLQQCVLCRDRNKLAALHTSGKLELWNLETRSAQVLVQNSQEMTPSRGISDSITGNSLCEASGQSGLRLYDWDTGRLLCELTEFGGFGPLAHYDPAGRQVYAWTWDGFCLKYMEHRKAFGFRLWRTGSD
jgi:hypothetical protein